VVTEKLNTEERDVGIHCYDLIAYGFDRTSCGKRRFDEKRRVVGGLASSDDKRMHEVLRFALILAVVREADNLDALVLSV
jgi:hypothetical protein